MPHVCWIKRASSCSTVKHFQTCYFSSPFFISGTCKSEKYSFIFRTTSSANVTILGEFAALCTETRMELPSMQNV